MVAADSGVVGYELFVESVIDGEICMIERKEEKSQKKYWVAGTKNAVK